MSTVRLTVLVEGNARGYYVSGQELAEHLRARIDGALTDLDDVQAWSVQIATETTTEGAAS